jgi:hypothetical protein
VRSEGGRRRTPPSIPVGQLSSRPRKPASLTLRATTEGQPMLPPPPPISPSPPRPRTQRHSVNAGGSAGFCSASSLSQSSRHSVPESSSTTVFAPGCTPPTPTGSRCPTSSTTPTTSSTRSGRTCIAPRRIWKGQHHTNGYPSQARRGQHCEQHAGRHPASYQACLDGITTSYLDFLYGLHHESNALLNTLDAPCSATNIVKP